MASVQKKLCQKAADLVDRAESLVNGVEFLVNNKAGQLLIEKAGPEAKEALETIKSTSGPGIRVARSLFDEIDKVLEGPLCKRASRIKKKSAGIAEVKRLFDRVGKDKAFDQICRVSKTIITILREVLNIANKILSSGIAKLAVTTVATAVGGPGAGAAALATINSILPKASQTVEFASTVQQFICDDLRKALKNA